MTRTRTARAALVAGAAMAIVSLTAGTALATWSTVGTGTGSATTTTINPPLTGNVTLTGMANAVTVAVNAAPATGAPVSGYRVDRTAPTALSGACFIVGTTGSCNAPADGTGTQTYSIVSFRGTQALQYWNSTALSRTGTPAAAALAITGVTRPGSSKKVEFNGSGASAGSALTVIICTVNSWDCPSANVKATLTITSPSAGAWGPTPQSGTLADNTEYYARATQGSRTSAILTFTLPS